MVDGAAEDSATINHQLFGRGSPMRLIRPFRPIRLIDGAAETPQLSTINSPTINFSVRFRVDVNVAADKNVRTPINS